MEEHGHGIGLVGWVLSAHTAGMFAFAPLAGWFSDRYGRIPAIVVGAATLVAATALTALAGEAPPVLMFPGLYLLGLGWSFAMVASSALLTESVGGNDAVSAQGTADLLSSVAAGMAALASGLVFTMAGFHILSAVGIVVSGLLMVVAWVHGRMSGRPQAAVVG
jgi:MFS family permease